MDHIVKIIKDLRRWLEDAGPRTEDSHLYHYCMVLLMDVVLNPACFCHAFCKVSWALMIPEQAPLVGFCEVTSWAGTFLMIPQQAPQECEEVLQCGCLDETQLEYKKPQLWSLCFGSPSSYNSMMESHEDYNSAAGFHVHLAVADLWDEAEAPSHLLNQ